MRAYSKTEALYGGIAVDQHDGLPSISKEDIQKVFGSREGQALIQLLTRSSGAQLKRAADALRQGKPEMAQELMRSTMESPDVAALVDQIRRK